MIYQPFVGKSCCHVSWLTGVFLCVAFAVASICYISPLTKVMAELSEHGNIAEKLGERKHEWSDTN